MLHGGGDRPAADASSTLAEAASSVQEEPAAPPQGADPAAKAQGQAPDGFRAEAVSQRAAASPPAPGAADAEATSFAPQTPEVSQTEALPPSDARPAAASGTADGTADAAQQAPLEYVSRDNQTPHMERKLRNLQVSAGSVACNGSIAACCLCNGDESSRNWQSNAVEMKHLMDCCCLCASRHCFNKFHEGTASKRV